MTVNKKHKKMYLTLEANEEYNEEKVPKKTFAEFKF